MNRLQLGDCSAMQKHHQLVRQHAHNNQLGLNAASLRMPRHASLQHSHPCEIHDAAPSTCGYNPNTGRFLTTDPIPGGNANTYTYPTDPINMFDLGGQFSWGHIWSAVVQAVTHPIATIHKAAAVAAYIYHHPARVAKSVASHIKSGIKTAIHGTPGSKANWSYYNPGGSSSPISAAGPENHMSISVSLCAYGCVGLTTQNGHVGVTYGIGNGLYAGGNVSYSTSTEIGDSSAGTAGAKFGDLVSVVGSLGQSDGGRPEASAGIGIGAGEWMGVERRHQFF